MAASQIITCPECDKKFRPKADVSGKKIKCPFCTHAFVVPVPKEAKADKGRPEAAKAGKAKASADGKAAAAVAEDAPQVKAVNEEDDVDPYGVKQVDLVPRCPNCTHEMGSHEIICLNCGYNTLTRQWGRTEKTLGVTGKRQFLHLLPALSAAAFTLLAIIGLLVYDSFIPNIVAGEEWWEWMDSEAVRMWLALICFPLFWAAGVFCFYRFIQKPIPDEIQLD